jgi:hypothetical protein
MQSLRGVGYSPETALADLIDNSITAGASSVEINIDWAEEQPRVEVLDDGRGMDEATLEAAMRFGGEGPGQPRSEDDLGRFGLGLKTASLSQCRRLTVIACKNGTTSSLTWDVDHVEDTNEWEVIEPSDLPDSELTQQLRSSKSGVLVIWERMDSIGGLFGLDKAALYERISHIRSHLSMVFHRYLEGDACP